VSATAGPMRAPITKGGSPRSSTWDIVASLYERIQPSRDRAPHRRERLSFRSRWAAASARRAGCRRAAQMRRDQGRDQHAAVRRPESSAEVAERYGSQCMSAGARGEAPRRRLVGRPNGITPRAYRRGSLAWRKEAVEVGCLARSRDLDRTRRGSAKASGIALTASGWYRRGPCGHRSGGLGRRPIFPRWSRGRPTPSPSPMLLQYRRLGIAELRRAARGPLASPRFMSAPRATVVDLRGRQL